MSDELPAEVRDGRDLGAFIPSVLDDYPLDPYEFRVYARIVRRASGKSNTRGHDESTTAMGKALACSDRQVRYALQVLERAGLVVRTARPGQSDRFDLTPHEQWVAPDQVAKIRAAVKARKPATTPAPPTAAPGTAVPGAGGDLEDTEDPGTTDRGTTYRGTSCRTPRHHVPDTPAPGADEGSPPRASREGESSASPRSAATGRGPQVPPVTVDLDGDQVDVDPHERDASFAVWWSLYPRHPKSGSRGGGGNRKKSLERWRRLSPGQRAAALDRMANYHRHLDATGYPPEYAEKWIANRRWDDFDAPPATGTDGLDPVALKVAEVCRIDVDRLTGQARGDLVTAAQAITAADGDADAVADVAGRWRREFDGAPLTPPALVRHWARFAGSATGTAVRVCPRCRQQLTDRHDDASCARVAALFGGGA